MEVSSSLKWMMEFFLLLFFFYILLLKIFPLLFSLFLSKILKSKIRFSVDVFRFQLYGLQFINESFDLRIRVFKILPDFSSSDGSYLIAELSGVQINLPPSDTHFSKNTSSSSSIISKNDIFFVGLELIKKTLGLVKLTSDSLKINKGHFSSLSLKNSIAFKDPDILRIDSDSVSVFIGDSSVESEVSISVSFGDGVCLKSVVVNCLRTRGSISKEGIPARSRNKSGSSNGRLSTFLAPDFFLDVEAQLLTMEFPEINSRASIGMLKIRKEESLSLTLINLFISDDSGNLVSFDALNFHSSGEKTHVAFVTDVKIERFERLVILSKKFNKKSDTSVRKTSEKFPLDIEIEVIIKSISVQLIEDLRINLPAVTLKCDESVGVTLNFDYLWLFRKTREILSVQDVLILLHSRKLSCTASSLTATEEVFRALVSISAALKSDKNDSSGSSFFDEFLFELADLKGTFGLDSSLSFVFNVHNVVAASNILQNHSKLSVSSLQCYLKKSSKMNRVLLLEGFSVNRIIFNRIIEIGSETDSKLIMVWRPDVHLCVYQMITKTYDNLKLISFTSKECPKPKMVGSFKTFSVKITMQMPSREITMMAENVFLEFKTNYTKIALPHWTVSSDNRKIVKSSGLVVKYNYEKIYRSEREEAEGFQDMKNKSIEIFLNEWIISFDHDLVFYDIFFVEFLGHIKWIKRLHNLGKKSPNQIPPDIIVYAKELQVYFQEDPFETRIKENYELMRDEYFESEKRKKVLESKIEDLKKSHLILPINKIEKLFSDLSKKDEDIYVKRAQNYHSKSKKKSTLLSWNISSFHFVILADKSLQESVIEFIQKVDQESPWFESLEFVTKIHRWIRFECKRSTVFLRDFSQPLADLKHVLMWGKIALADEVPVERALKTYRIEIDDPFGEQTIDRSMVAVKVYHDLAMDMETFEAAHGPCWEPVLTHFSITLSNVFGVSSDPSPPLPWWDKIRFLLHGRFLASCKSFKLMLHTSPDPYNTTEEIELNFLDSNFHWSNNGILKCSGDLNVFIRNESKYDDCRLLHIPGLNFSIKFDWVCLSNPRDHHSVIPCAPNKVPEYSHTFDHDSYRAFRSQNLNARLSLEGSHYNKNYPHIHMYSSTVRWLESIKWLFSGVSRPIRRGSVFLKKPLPKKPSFFRHLKKVQIFMSLRQLQLDYWMSASMNKGVLLNLANGMSLSAEYNLKLVGINDGLRHRKRSEWSNIFLNCELSTTDIWFQCSKIQDEERFLEKSFFFSVENVKYSRELDKPNNSNQDMLKDLSSNTLIVQGARGAWTLGNRDMCFSLYDSWMRANVLRQQMSSEALKGITIPNTNAIPNPPTPNSEEAPILPPCITPPPPDRKKPDGELSMSNLATWKYDEDIVGKLLNSTDEATHTPIVYSEDQSSDNKKKDMEAMLACSKDDILHKKWNIKFINSQVLLKGIKTEGHVILSASKAEVVLNIHLPVWQDRTLLSKKSWSGCLESMQCFATVSPNKGDTGDNLNEDQISWLTKDIIEEREAPVATVSDLVGSGQSVGGVISKIVGSEDEELQRIVSRCRCEFFYVDYDDCEGLLKKIPRTEEFQWYPDNVVNSFSLIHYDLNISTNSLQYSVIFDILNNLLLYIEPAFKSRTENYLRMKYNLLLSNIEDQWKPITQLQNKVRQLVCLLRQKEKAIYNLENSLKFAQSDERESLEVEAQSLKDRINSTSQELEVRIRCLREFQLTRNQKKGINYEETKLSIRQKSEIFFSRAQWRLTEMDGQLGIADASISNFFYTKTLMRDDTAEHSLEMGYIYVKNLLPNQIYEDVLFPTELQRDAPLDKHPTLRVFCRDKPPVGGISVKDHFEINLSPLTISITHALYYKILYFCFPEKQEYDEASKKSGKRKQGSLKEKTKSSFYVKFPSKNEDYIELMKDRAQQNKLFVSIKIPEVPICISYKGEKEKNQISDLSNFVLHVPHLEYHNVTWTWLDLLLAIKTHSKDALISQLIKEKLKLRHRSVSVVSSQDEDEKAKLLLGMKGSSKAFIKR